MKRRAQKGYLMKINNIYRQDNEALEKAYFLARLAKSDIKNREESKKYWAEQKEKTEKYSIEWYRYGDLMVAEDRLKASAEYYKGLAQEIIDTYFKNK